MLFPRCLATFTRLPTEPGGCSRVGLSALSVAACLVIAAVVARWRLLARPLQYMGQRTIAVYVVHPLLLALVVSLLPAGSVPAVVAVLALTALAVVVPLTMHRALRRASGVFDLPAQLSCRLALHTGRTPRPAPGLTSTRSSS